ncbi:MAG: GNAT family N-acetyltransferase [Bacteroidetes bacterium]|nr:GNAT family N-acetyltransferase [Bacteroidota bacterium]
MPILYLKNYIYKLFYAIIILSFAYCNNQTNQNDSTNQSISEIPIIRNTGKPKPKIKEDLSKYVTIDILNNKYSSELFNLCDISNPENVKHLEKFMPLTLKQHGESWIKTNKDLTHYQKEKRYAIKYKDKLAGLIGLQNYGYFKDDLHTVDIFYWLGKDFCRKGIMNYSLSQLFDQLFLESENADNKTPIDRIHIIIEWDKENNRQNLKSRKVVERLKCKPLKRNEKGGYNYKKWIYDPLQKNCIVYYMTKKDWLEKSQKY